MMFIRTPNPRWPSTPCRRSNAVTMMTPSGTFMSLMALPPAHLCFADNLTSINSAAAPESPPPEHPCPAQNAKWNNHRQMRSHNARSSKRNDSQCRYIPPCHTCAAVNRAPNFSATRQPMMLCSSLPVAAHKPCPPPRQCPPAFAGQRILNRSVRFNTSGAQLRRLSSCSISTICIRVCPAFAPVATRSPPPQSPRAQSACVPATPGHEVAHRIRLPAK